MNKRLSFFRAIALILALSTFGWLGIFRLFDWLFLR